MSDKKTPMDFIEKFYIQNINGYGKLFAITKSGDHVKFIIAEDIAYEGQGPEIYIMKKEDKS